MRFTGAETNYNKAKLEWEGRKRETGCHGTLGRTSRLFCSFISETQFSLGLNNISDFNVCSFYCTSHLST